MRCVTAFLLVAATALPTDGAYGQGDRVFIDVTEAAALLARPGAVVLDVGRPDSLVRAGRIPGARALPLREIVVTRNGHLTELPPVEDVARALAARGVRDGAPVLLYGEPLAAARAWLTLDVLGHGAGARILDGGLAAWRAAGRPLETGAT
ncbi:MAG: rhodanese-like domain-containing protein, partial [Gemmatimonadales bacterium]|nr:rhodanese-like domain-containing protein [Gemmatimonadales bacterium]